MRFQLQGERDRGAVAPLPASAPGKGSQAQLSCWF